MSRILITGTGRCGTGFMAATLRAAGVRCGHEQVYTISVGLGNEPPNWDVYQAECSWLAAPFLSEAEVPVVHLVRHPLAYVRSAVEISLFKPSHHSAYTKAIYQRFAQIVDEKTVYDRALAMWLHWNQLIHPHATLRYRLEDVDCRAVGRIAALGSHDVVAAEIAWHRTVPDESAYNRKTGEKKQRIPLPDATLFRPALLDQAREHARLYHYEGW